jgi:signal transduction histidine kinase
MILERIDRETQRLTYLVDNVLRFSRRGRWAPADREPVDVTSEIEQIVADFQPLAAARRGLIALVADPIPPLQLERDALREIMLNLLDNAVKYGPPDETIAVTVRLIDAAVRIVVADRGPGVVPGERERIWHPFVRGAASQARGVGGSGIGLTIVRDAATRHGGAAWVTACEGGGAVFIVELPAVAEKH